MKLLKYFLILLVILVVSGTGFLAFSDVKPTGEKVSKTIDNARFK